MNGRGFSGKSGHHTRIWPPVGKGRVDVCPAMNEALDRITMTLTCGMLKGRKA